MDKQDILKVKERYVELYQLVRKEQLIDQSYRNDTFAIPEVKKPHVPLRLGIGARMVDAPAEQMITNNPVCDFEMLGRNKKSSIALSKLVNQIWLPSMRRTNPNPYKESIKNKLCRGESYIRLAQNSAYADSDDKTFMGLPVIFMTPDPMVIYGSPEEDDSGWYPNCGVPNEVVVFYERQPEDVVVRYPEWGNSAAYKKATADKTEVEWFEYWNKGIRYFSAGGDAVLKGEIQPNPYKKVPFVRKYSGFGRRSSDGELAELIVGDLRFNRDLIKELYIESSNISSILSLFAHRAYEVWSPSEINKDVIKNLDFGAYSLLVMENVPAGTEHQFIDVPEPSQETYQHIQTMMALLNQRNPFLLAGLPIGANARQQDMASSAAMARYMTVLENTEVEWATAIEMALSMCRDVPGLIPEGVDEEDLKAQFKCTVHLKAEDPIERDRLITLGDRLRATGGMSLKSFLMECRGLTEDKAEDEIAQILAEKVTIQSPEWAAIMGMEAAEEAGMEMELAKVKQLGAGVQGKEVAPTTMQRTMGEAQTEQGMENPVEPNRGARTPPSNYQRGM